MKRFIIAVLAASTLSALSFVAPASAQASRTWVSGVGDDVNPCSRTAPCKTFAGAISKTATAGEINCLDPAGYGTLTITKSITINCYGTLGSVLASGVPGFTVNGAGAVVVIDSVEVEGINSGTTGINVIQASKVFVRNTTIRHFTGAGVNVASTDGTSVVINDSNIVQNGGGGVNVAPAAGNNFVTLLHDTIDHNTTFAVAGNTAGAQISAARSYLTGSAAGLQLTNGATAASFGPSNVLGGTGAFTSTINFK